MGAVEVQRSFTQGAFDAFAALSGDDNPIHVDPGFAARSAFGRTVAHGAMLSAVLRATAALLCEGRKIKTQAVMFPAPAYADEPLRFVAEKVGDDSLACRAVRAADGEEVCVMTITLASLSSGSRP